MTLAAIQARAAAGRSDGDPGLARKLLRRVAAALAKAPGARLEIAAVIADYLACPSPASYVEAAGRLDRVRREAALHRIGLRVSEAAHREALAELEALGADEVVDPELCRTLARLPVTPTSGVRLQGLVALVAATAELAARAEAATRVLFEKLRAEPGRKAGPATRGHGGKGEDPPVRRPRSGRGAGVPTRR